MWQSECCGECGVHPSVWDEKSGGHRHAVVPTWKYCRVCDLLAQAEEAGPPSESSGWRLVLERKH